jgi:hypothetical protein
MNFEQTPITLYDPQGRCLDLVKELAPFFQSTGEWTNCSITGSYLSCAQYIITRRLANLGLMSVSSIKECESIDSNSFELLLCSGMAVEKGYTFPASELELLRDLTSKTQIIISPNLPDLPM